MPEPDPDTRTPLPAIAHVGSEHQLLAEFLDYFRTVFVRKVEDLDDAQARVRVPPSDLDLLGLTRHLADVERWWFRAVMVAEVENGNYESETDPDLDWHHTPDDTLADAIATWRREVVRAREIIDQHDDLDAIAARSSGGRGDISLRWILLHMIEEYARHCGHADVLREAVDGVTGD
ncbi:MAG: DinB family protein [Acidimicrobiales bacterium]